jgi:hypothetical protein
VTTDDQKKPYGFDDFFKDAKASGLTIADLLPQLKARLKVLEAYEQAFEQSHCGYVFPSQAARDGALNNFAEGWFAALHTVGAAPFKIAVEVTEIKTAIQPIKQFLDAYEVPGAERPNSTLYRYTGKDGQIQRLTIQDLRTLSKIIDKYA